MMHLRDRIPIRFSIILTILTACLPFLVGCGQPQELSKKQLVIATGSKSGIYYPVGEVIARIIKEKFADVQVEVLETEGSVHNLNLLGEGKANLALVQNDIAHYALFGENMFSGKKLAGIFGLATLFPEVVHIVTHKKDTLTDFSLMAGKKIAIGTENSGTFYNAQQILMRAKVWDQVQHLHIPPGDALVEFEKGAIDGLFFSSGIPNVKIADLASRSEIFFVPMAPDLIQSLVNEFPFYFPSEIPEGAYSQVASSVLAIEINSLLVSNSSLTENDHYLITKALFGSLETLKTAHPVLNSISNLSLRRQMSIPISPGATKALAEP